MPGPDADSASDAHTVASALRQAAAVLAARRHRGGRQRCAPAAWPLPWTLSSADILRAPERALSPAAGRSVLRGYIERRARREPVSRILGERDFYGRSFAISPATLDPRPDSETLIAAALELVREEAWTTRPLRILDVGTGSGCLLLTLLAELPAATGLGTDISPAALDAARITPASLDWLIASNGCRPTPLKASPGGFHMLVANPPYVRTAEIAALEPEVRSFDPVQALDGGADGLDFYRRLVFATGRTCRKRLARFRSWPRSGGCGGRFAGGATRQSTHLLFASIAMSPESDAVLQREHEVEHTPRNHLDSNREPG